MNRNPYDSPRSGEPNQLWDAARPGVRTLQIITFAMVAGVSAFAIFSLVTQGFAMDGEPDFLCWTGIAFAAACIVFHLLIPKINVSVALKRLDFDQIKDMSERERCGQLIPIFQTGHIIACALLEGAIFMNVFAYFSTHYVGSLIVSAILIGMILIRFPTVSSVTRWMENRIQDLHLGY